MNTERSGVDASREETCAAQVDRILLRIRQLARGIDRHSRARIREGSVTVPQLLCLRAVADGGLTTAGAVASAVHLNSSTVSGILDRLVARGLLERSRDRRDRRAISLAITAAGRTCLRESPLPLGDAFVRDLCDLPEMERESLVSALDRLVELLERSGIGEPRRETDPPDDAEPGTREEASG